MSDERDAFEQHPSALDLIDAARENLAEIDRGRAALPGSPEGDGALCALIEEGRYDDPEAGAALRRWLQARNELSLFAWNPLFLMRVKG